MMIPCRRLQSPPPRCSCPASSIQTARMAVGSACLGFGQEAPVRAAATVGSTVEVRRYMHIVSPTRPGLARFRRACRSTIYASGATASIRLTFDPRRPQRIRLTERPTRPRLTARRAIPTMWPIPSSPRKADVCAVRAIEVLAGVPLTVLRAIPMTRPTSIRTMGGDVGSVGASRMQRLTSDEGHGCAAKFGMSYGPVVA